jgi:hypothetical protein
VNGKPRLMWGQGKARCSSEIQQGDSVSVSLGLEFSRFHHEAESFIHRTEKSITSEREMLYIAFEDTLIRFAKYNMEDSGPWQYKKWTIESRPLTGQNAIPGSDNL